MIGREKLTEETMIGRDVFQNISPLSASVHCSLCGSRSVSRWTSLQSKNVSMQCIMDGMRKCWSLTIRGRVVVDPSLSGSCAVRHYRSAYPPLNHIAIGIPESQSLTYSYWWVKYFYFLLLLRLTRRSWARPKVCANSWPKLNWKRLKICILVISLCVGLLVNL